MGPGTVTEVKQTLGLGNGSIAAERKENRINAMIDIREELLGEQQPERLHEEICKGPHIEVKIQDVRTHALFDSGSEVTAISEEFYEDNKKVFKDCTKIPINGKIVKGAIGEKTTAIKLQVLCNVSLGIRTEQLIILIIPKLGKNCIIGYDTI